MPSTSFAFIAFVIFSASLYRLVPADKRNQLLISINLTFLFFAGQVSLAAILLVASFTHCCARLLIRARTSHMKKTAFRAGVYGNIVILISAKYLLGKGISFLPYTDLTPPLYLVLGISFYILQAIDYLIFIRDSGETDLSAADLFNYLAFFPKLPAGPIIAARDFFVQKPATDTIRPEEIVFAAKRILWGLFKKIVIANRLKILTMPVLTHPSTFTGFEIIIAVYALAIQIYCDFSAYCDIAAGVARLFGYQLPENFSKPYLASSVKDFWRRWHITLTSWLQRHVYIPLGGNRTTRGRRAFNITVVFMVSGLWHGIAPTFIAWAGINAFLYLASQFLEELAGKTERFSAPLKNGAWLRPVRIFLTFNVVAFSWVPFAASTLADAGAVFAQLLSSPLRVSHPQKLYLFAQFGGMDYLLLFSGLTLWFLVSFSRAANDLYFQLSRGWKLAAELALIDIMFCCILLSGNLPAGEFMYVQF